jgi:hypothetical protein
MTAGHDGTRRPPRWLSLLVLALGTVVYGLIQIALLICGLVGWVVGLVVDVRRRIVRWCSGLRSR